MVPSDPVICGIYGSDGQRDKTIWPTYFFKIKIVNILIGIKQSPFSMDLSSAVGLHLYVNGVLYDF